MFVLKFFKLFYFHIIAFFVYLLKIKQNTYFILSCFYFIFAGYPQPQYRWLKDGIPIGDFSSSQYLRILNTQREDAGSYKCIAKNDAGSIFSEKIDVVVACKYDDILNCLLLLFYTFKERNTHKYL